MDNDRWEREKEERLRRHLSRLKKHGIVSRVIEDQRERYEHEGNIFSAWYAYLVARQTGAAIPDWILEALDDVSTRPTLSERPHVGICGIVPAPLAQPAVGCVQHVIRSKFC